MTGRSRARYSCSSRSSTGHHVSVAVQVFPGACVDRRAHPRGRLRVFTKEEGGSHFPFFEEPGAFCRQVAAFVTEHSATKAATTTTV